MCETIAPKVFRLNENRQSEAVNPEGDTVEKILEAAESVTSSQSSSFPELTISIGPEGGIRMVTEGTGLPLDMLQQEHGAQMIYRVTQQESRVRLEGRAGSRTCLFEAERTDGAARILLGDGPRYTMSPKLAIGPPTSSSPPNWQSKDAGSDQQVLYF